MKYGKLREWTRELPVFSARDVATLSEQDSSSVLVSLHRWEQKGSIERLRRGLYTLNERDREVPLTPAYLASVLVEPSYLSGVWLLAQHSVIPEAVFTVTSATRGRMVQFENTFGRFVYRRLPERAWFGYAGVEVQGYRVLQADREKALLDAIYWSGLTWDRLRFQQERVNAGRLKERRLQRYAERWGLSRLRRSVAAFEEYRGVTCPTW